MTPTLPSYRALLEELALLDGLCATRLLASEELLIGELRIGLMCEGDAHNGDILLYTSLGKPAREREQAIDRLLLEANHLGTGTAGCTLGRHSTTGVVTLCARTPIPLTHALSLSDLLQAFHAIAILWRDEIERPCEPRAHEMN
ncbi:type III secretion system chaperone [Robbsia sp. Bb-Pol-6]|uniref:Type III secretion system chaperone n=1 Tax=Robbsia betulipollinis TaxID=2981849 RepID=A0ABT3ZLH2_9BURK|nr:type III secretion system chaperone [Robbsia betulipollinis]MCY0387262.1 type III secretion system chaperone [Robbsia betulipollinis]